MSSYVDPDSFPLKKLFYIFDSQGVYFDTFLILSMIPGQRDLRTYGSITNILLNYILS